jgi:hypothetical protein
VKDQVIAGWQRLRLLALVLREENHVSTLPLKGNSGLVEARCFRVLMAAKETTKQVPLLSKLLGRVDKVFARGHPQSLPFVLQLPPDLVDPV